MSNPTCDQKTHPSSCACCEWRLTVELPELRDKVLALEDRVKEFETAIEKHLHITERHFKGKCDERIFSLESALGMAREAIKEAQEKIEARSREHACAGWQCSECAPADVASGLAEVLSSIPATDGLECNDMTHTWAGATCNDCGKPTKQKEIVDHIRLEEARSAVIKAAKRCQYERRKTIKTGTFNSAEMLDAVDDLDTALARLSEGRNKP